MLFRDDNYENPDNQLRNLYFHKTPLIYNGKDRPVINKMIKDPEMKIIQAVGPNYVDFDVDLTERKNLLSFIFNKWNKSYKQKTKIKKQQLENMKDDEFLSFVKTYWVAGEEKPFKLINKKQKTDIELLIKHLEEDKNKSYKTLFILIGQGVNPYYIEAQILEFIEYQSSLSDEDKELILSQYRNSRDFFKATDHRLNLMFLLSLLV